MISDSHTLHNIGVRVIGVLETWITGGLAVHVPRLSIPTMYPVIDKWLLASDQIRQAAAVLSRLPHAVLVRM